MLGIVPFAEGTILVTPSISVFDHGADLYCQLYWKDSRILFFWAIYRLSWLSSQCRDTYFPTFFFTIAPFFVHLLSFHLQGQAYCALSVQSHCYWEFWPFLPSSSPFHSPCPGFFLIFVVISIILLDAIFVESLLWSLISAVIPVPGGF